MQSQSATQHYSIWQAPIAAWYNKSFYADVANNWNGSGALYMFVMCFVAALISIAPVALVCYQASNDKNLPVFLQQVPQITYQNGQVSIDKPSPYQIKDDKGTVVAEFRCNETGTPKLADGGATNPPIIITKDVLYLGNPSTTGSGEPQVYQFGDLKTMWDKVSFNGTDILHWIQTATFWIPFGLFAISLPMVYLGHLLQMLIYAGIAQMIFSNKQVAITYGTGMRLAAMAMTPAIVVTMLLHAMEVVPSLKVVSALGILLMTVVSIVLAITALIVASHAAAPAPADMPPAAAA